MAEHLADPIKSNTIIGMRAVDTEVAIEVVWANSHVLRTLSKDTWVITRQLNALNAIQTAKITQGFTMVDQMVTKRVQHLVIGGKFKTKDAVNLVRWVTFKCFS